MRGDKAVKGMKAEEAETDVQDDKDGNGDSGEHRRPGPIRGARRPDAPERLRDVRRDDRG